MAKRQEAHIKGQMLKWARESTNLELEDAAVKLGVAPERLAEWETGERRPTINQLRKAGNVYKRPLAAFFLAKAPKDFHVPHDFRRLPGRPAQALSPEFITELRAAQYRRSLAIELAEEIVETPREFIGSASRATNKDSLADRIRNLLGITLDIQKSWRDSYQALNAWKDAIENIGVLVFHFSRVEVDEARGFSICDRPFPVISVNGKDAPTGRVFTLLHELCHLLLGHGGTCDLREYRGAQSPDQRIEVFCNHVAGAMLVPADDLAQHELVRNASRVTEWQDRQLRDMSSLYRVSREVLLRRLLIIGKTSHRFYRAKRQELHEAEKQRRERAGGWLSYPRRVIRTVGHPFLRIVLNAYYREAITTSDLSEYLGARMKHLPAIEHHLSGPSVLTGGDL